MKTTDFAHWLTRYLAVYLPNERGVAALTVDSYRQAFSQYLEFMESVKGVKPEKMTLSKFDKTNTVGFLDWLENEKGNSTHTRNQRLAALKGFARYLSGEYPDYLEEYQGILAITEKKAHRKEISYLKTEGVALLVKQVNRHAPNGYRDLLIIMLFYTTGIRVSELTLLNVEDVHFGEPSTLLVHGKGGKDRFVPILSGVKPHLKEYLKRMGYDNNASASEALFKNHLGMRFNRRGLSYLIKKYANKARAANPDLIPMDLSPHKLRHTAAMELLASGVELIHIRDLLGHASVTTTEGYARADSKQKRQAIENAARYLLPPEEAKWEANKNIKEWLKSFGK